MISKSKSFMTLHNVKKHLIKKFTWNLCLIANHLCKDMLLEQWLHTLAENLIVPLFHFSMHIHSIIFQVIIQLPRIHILFIHFRCIKTYSYSQNDTDIKISSWVGKIMLGRLFEKYFIQSLFSTCVLPRLLLPSLSTP